MFLIEKGFAPGLKYEKNRNKFNLSAIFIELLIIGLVSGAGIAQEKSSSLIVPVAEENAAVDLNTSKLNSSDDDSIVVWTLRDAIANALDNNVDIAIERKNVKISELNLKAAQGVYDPV